MAPGYSGGLIKQKYSFGKKGQIYFLEADMKKITLQIIIFLTWGLINSNTNAAALVTCNGYIKDLYVEAEREDDPTFNNKLYIVLGDENGNNITCNGSSYAYIDNSKAAYSGILATTLSAYAANREVMLYVNPSINGPASYTIELAIIRLSK